MLHDLAAAAGAPLTPRTQALDAQLRHAHTLLAAWERAHASMQRSMHECDSTLTEAKARVRQLQKELTQAQDATVAAVEAARQEAVGPLRTELLGIKVGVRVGMWCGCGWVCGGCGWGWGCKHAAGTCGVMHG